MRIRAWAILRNAAAALLGGFVVSAADDGSGVVDAIRFDAPRDLRAVVFVPELRLSTQDMRAALPVSARGCGPGA